MLSLLILALMLVSSASLIPSLPHRAFLSTLTTAAFTTSLFPLSASASPLVSGEESIMSSKAHGTTATAVPDELLWNTDAKLADKICSFNRHWAEPARTWTSQSDFIAQVKALKPGEAITFFDSVSNEPLFKAPVGRSGDEFLAESKSHGWPSFRDSEVVWETVRVLKDGETVSVGGTHLGHNLPDRTGNRYCVNLCCVAGKGKK